MQEMVKMVVVLTVLSCLSGGLLAAIRNNTQEQIEIQQLKFVKGPEIKRIFEDATNDPISDRFKLVIDETEKTFFVASKDGKPRAVAFETFGKGYGGDVGVMVGVNLETGEMVGVGVTTHAETPGMGAKAKSDLSFVQQFTGKPLKAPIQVAKDGGEINAISGATITSRAVCSAATQAAKIYEKIKPELEKKVKDFGK